MEHMQITCLREHPSLVEEASRWFSDKWGIPVEAYRVSMGDCIRRKTAIPQWYVVLNGKQEIVAGAGVIENDFHDRTHLAPNLCALFVEAACRNRGIAEGLLDFIRSDMQERGIPKLYLVTEHTGLYEKYGWEFLTTVIGDDHMPIRMYAATSESVPPGA